MADSLLKAGRFKVRAVTRNPSSDKAKVLADRGAELVQADFNDKASLAKVLCLMQLLWLMQLLIGTPPVPMHRYCTCAKTQEGEQSASIQTSQRNCAGV